MQNNNQKKKVETVKSLEKALAILNLFSNDRKALGVTEISKLLGYSKTSTHRIVSVLTENEFLIKNEDSKYMIGPGAYRVGNMYAVSGSFKTSINSVLRKTRDNTDVTIQLCVLEGNELLVINSYESGQFIKIVATTGMSFPLIDSASGGAVLAAMSDLERTNRIETMDLDDNKRQELELLIEEVRKKGYNRSVSIYTSSQLIVYAKAITPKVGGKWYVIEALVLESMLTEELEEKIIFELNKAVDALSFDV